MPNYQIGLQRFARPDDDPCTVPPEGWFCTRPAGHDGPCAAVPIAGPKEKVQAVYDAIAVVQADPTTLDLFTRSAQGELNRVAHRCEGVRESIERDEDPR